jgi:hypothetical protein
MQADRTTAAPRRQGGAGAIEIHPNLAEVYRQRVAALQDALHAPSSRDEAFDLIRSLIEQIRALASLGQRRPGKTLAAGSRS